MWVLDCDNTTAMCGPILPIARQRTSSYSTRKSRRPRALLLPSERNRARKIVKPFFSNRRPAAHVVSAIRSGYRLLTIL